MIGIGLVRIPYEVSGLCLGKRERSVLRSGHVILELCEREEIIPVVLPLINKETEELLQFLINPFHLSISLGVVRGSGCQLNSKKSVQLFCKLRYKLGASVRHYSLG